MLDVVFVLLTFFIFAMVLSKRFTITDIRLPETSLPGESPATNTKQIVVSLKPDGIVMVGEETASLELLPGLLAKRQRENPGAKLFLAPDAAASSGELFHLMDTLAKAGIRDLRFLRKPATPGAPAEPAK